MSKSKSAVEVLQDNPAVLIRYNPPDAPLALAQNTTKMLAKVNSATAITSPKQLETVSTLISDAQIASGEVETFVVSLREGIQRACERVRELPGYEDFEATLTIRKWSLRQMLNDGITRLKGVRARYLDADAEKVRKAQFEADAKQRKINEEAARKAAEAAKAAGADKETVKAIKEEVLATPAPIVESKAAATAKDAGVSLRYDYYAQITDIKKFLGLCLNSEIMLNTLKGAIPDIESAFRKMAQDQKESFSYAGISYRKQAVDVSRRR